MNAGKSRLEPLADALSAYLRKSGIADAADRRRVLVEWRERVGDRIADVATPLRLDRDTLIVGVRSSAWLMELKLMETRLVERVNRGLGDNRIENIRLVLASAGPMADPAGGATTKGTGADG